MTLELTIQSLFDTNPLKFKERADCLNYLFCHVGNGYKWENGEIIIPDVNYSECEISNFQAHFVGGKAFQHDKISLQEEYVRVFQKSMNEFYDGKELPVEIQRAMEKHIAKLRETYPADVYHEYPRKERWESQSEFFKKYSRLLHVPDDVKPDWLAGVEECKAMLREDGFIV